MSKILVDSNVILDVLTEDPQWFEWSAQMLTHYNNQGDLVINRSQKLSKNKICVLKGL